MGIKIRTRATRDGFLSVYLDICHAGSRQYEYLGLLYDPKNRAAAKNAMALAEGIAAKRTLEIVAGGAGVVFQTSRGADFVQYYRDYIDARKDVHAPGSVRLYHAALTHVERYTGGAVPFSALHRKWAEGYRDDLVRLLHPNTAYAFWCKTKAVLRQAEKDEIIGRHPFLGVDGPKKCEVEKTYLDEREIAALVQTECRFTDVKTAFLFSCFTGLRVSDVISITWGQIESQGLKFRQKKTKEFVYLPLNETARNCIAAMAYGDKKSDARVFPLANVNHLGEKLKEWATAAKVKKSITFHTARHTYATLLLTKNVDLYTVSKLLGHSEIKTTQVYAKVIDRKKVEAVNALPVFGV